MPLLPPQSCSGCRPLSLRALVATVSAQSSDGNILAAADYGEDEATWGNDDVYTASGCWLLAPGQLLYAGAHLTPNCREAVLVLPRPQPARSIAITMLSCHPLSGTQVLKQNFDNHYNGNRGEAQLASHNVACACQACCGMPGQGVQHASLPADVCSVPSRHAAPLTIALGLGWLCTKTALPTQTASGNAECVKLSSNAAALRKFIRECRAAALPDGGGLAIRSAPNMRPSGVNAIQSHRWSTLSPHLVPALCCAEYTLTKPDTFYATTVDTVHFMQAGPICERWPARGGCCCHCRCRCCCLRHIVT